MTRKIPNARKVVSFPRVTRKIAEKHFCFSEDCSTFRILYEIRHTARNWRSLYGGQYRVGAYNVNKKLTDDGALWY